VSRKLEVDAGADHVGPETARSDVDLSGQKDVAEHAEEPLRSLDQVANADPRRVFGEEAGVFSGLDAGRVDELAEVEID